MLRVLHKETGRIYEEKTSRDIADELFSEIDFTDEFDSIIDECYPTWEFGGATYYPSDILPRIDYIMYNTAKTEYADNRMYYDFVDDLERGETGIYYIGDATLDIIENEQ